MKTKSKYTILIFIKRILLRSYFKCKILNRYIYCWLSPSPSHKNSNNCIFFVFFVFKILIKYVFYFVFYSINTFLVSKVVANLQYLNSLFRPFDIENLQMRQKKNNNNIMLRKWCTLDCLSYCRNLVSSSVPT